MNVCHCLFWIKDNKITAVLGKSNEMEIMKFGGNNSVDYTDDFWEKWCDYSGFLKKSLTDFCFVYDEEPCIPEYLKDRECPAEKCVWNRNKIQSAADLMNITHPLLVVNENEVPVARAGSFRNIREEDIVRLTARYRNYEGDISGEESETAEKTPFIEGMLAKLSEYDEEEARV